MATTTWVSENGLLPVVDLLAERRPRSECVRESLPQVRFLAGRLASRLPAHVDVEDLVQVGALGLLQAARRFDPRRSVKFQTYASRRAQGAMLDYLRSLDWRPRSVRKRNRRLEAACASVEQRLGSGASEEALAAEMGIGLEELRRWRQDARHAGNSRDGFSRSHPSAAGTQMERLPDPGETPEEALEKAQTQRLLAAALHGLPEREGRIVSLHYFQRLSMKEIALRMGLKPARVSQLHRRAIGRLRNRMLARPTMRHRTVPD